MHQAVPKLTRVTSFTSEEHDSLVVVYSATEPNKMMSCLVPLMECADLGMVQKMAHSDKAFSRHVQLVPLREVSGGKAFFSPVGGLDHDTDDVRKFSVAAEKGIKRAVDSGARSPILFLPQPATLHPEKYKRYVQVAILGALAGTYVPLERREYLEDLGKPCEEITSIGIITEEQDIEVDLEELRALEAGRRTTKDIGASNPERMRPENCVAYLEKTLAHLPGVEMEVLSDREALRDGFPLLDAVARASYAVPRHHPRLVKLTYTSPERSEVKRHLCFSGKGITYDTGGADIKAGGNMRGMSRDKLGAAAVAGLVHTVALNKVKHVDVTAFLAFVRNSVGADSYVSDEVIISRAGVRVMVGNTDAEGRMVMADPLCLLKEKALEQQEKDNSIEIHLFTVATLTGHVIRAYGHYGAAMSNGPAKSHKIARTMEKVGEEWGDPFEVSNLRPEDFDFGRPAPQGTCDVVQSNSQPSTMTSRAHQAAAAIITVASGLDEHGASQPDEKKRISFTHLDIAGSAEEGSSVGLDLPRATGSPVVVLYASFVRQE